MRGIGYSVMPMIVSLTGACLFRVAWIYLVFPLSPTLLTLYISYPISWILTFGVHLGCYLAIARKKLDQYELRMAADNSFVAVVVRITVAQYNSASCGHQ